MAVMVVVTDAQEAGPLVRWGARFALARETTLKILHVSRGSKAGEATEQAMDDPEDTHPVRVACRQVVDFNQLGFNLAYVRESARKLLKSL